MRPVHIPGATREFRAPDDWDVERQGRCGSLSIVDKLHENTHWMISRWELSPAELETIAKTGKIDLWISAPLHPVVALTVTQEIPEDDRDRRPAV